MDAESDSQTRRVRPVPPYGGKATEASVLDDLVKLTSALCAAPVAAMSIVDHHGHWTTVASTRAMPDEPTAVGEITRMGRFCAHAVDSGGPVFVIEEIGRHSGSDGHGYDDRDDDRLGGLSGSDLGGSRGDGLADEADRRPHGRTAAFFAGAPIVAADGRRTGVLWISDRAPRQLSDDQHENLRLLAGQAGRLLERRAMPATGAAVARLSVPPTDHLTAAPAFRMPAGSTTSAASTTPAGSSAPIGTGEPAAGTPEGAPPPSSMTDPVTRRGNRFWFSAELGTALRWAAASGTPISLITVDLARFNVLNTSLGPSAGDRVLRRAAADVASVLRRSDVLGRLGCDEFGILLPGADRRTAVAAAERIRAALLATERPDLVNVPLHAYFGTATYSPRQAGASRPPSANDMIRNSGLALAAAKREGPDQIRSYHSAMRSVARRQLALMEELTHAIDRGELHVHYQPLVILGTGRLRGAEALLRWNSARFGAVSPAEFIPLAEDTGLIVPIGRWVLEQACRDAASWSPRDRALGVSVNLSGYQLDDTIVPYVDDALRRSGLAPDLLTVEVTESALAADGGAAEALLHSLHARGVRLAVDDFGTGYSNLTALGHLPIDVLKIDKSFLDGIETEGRASRLLATVIAMGQGLGCTTLAEGIETLDQHQRLIELGCEHGQGFLFGKAAPGSVIEERTRTEVLAQVERPAG